MRKALITALFLLYVTSLVQAEERIAWYATWPEAVAAAKSQGRPILLMAAAVQCHGVSGVW